MPSSNRIKLPKETRFSSHVVNFFVEFPCSVNELVVVRESEVLSERPGTVLLLGPFQSHKGRGSSNPGPGGSKATNRKSEERGAADDRELAGALLAVLATFQKNDPAKGAGEPSAKKGKGGVLKAQPSQGPSLAQSLLQMVQSAIENN